MERVQIILLLKCQTRFVTLTASKANILYVILTFSHFEWPFLLACKN